MIRSVALQGMKEPRPGLFPDGATNDSAEQGPVSRASGHRNTDEREPFPACGHRGFPGACRHFIVFRFLLKQAPCQRLETRNFSDLRRECPGKSCRIPHRYPSVCRTFHTLNQAIGMVPSRGPTCEGSASQRLRAEGLSRPSYSSAGAGSLRRVWRLLQSCVAHTAPLRAGRCRCPPCSSFQRPPWSRTSRPRAEPARRRTERSGTWSDAARRPREAAGRPEADESRHTPGS